MTHNRHSEKADIPKFTGFGYQKADRLLKRPEFRRLYRSGREVANGYFSVRYRTRSLNGAMSSPRLGVTVSKRVGNAVVRNRIKRLVREFFRCNRNLLPHSIDLNVIARRGAANQLHHRLRASLETLFVKIQARESHQSTN